MAATTLLISLALLAQGSQASAGIVAKLGRGKLSASEQQSPPVEMSHDKFFGKDLPHDAQPKPDPSLRFEHPYPVVQEKDEYDQDYPQDENGDGGEWEAQYGYDVARNHLVKQAATEKKAKVELDAAEKELEAAKHKKEQAEQALNKAQAVVHGAEAEKANAEHQVKETEQTTDPQEDPQIAAAMKEVELKAKNLEGCQQQLADAKAKLDQLLQGLDQAEREKVTQVTQAIAVQPAQPPVQPAQPAAQPAQPAVDNQAQIEAAKQAKKQVEEIHKAAEEKLAREQKEHEQSKKSFEKAQSALNKAQEDAESAEDKLRQFRSPPTKVHSGASRPAGLVGALAAVLVAALF